MSHRANGSLVHLESRTVVGSELAQAFDEDQWFSPRPGSYDPAASGASNLRPNNPDLIDAVRARSTRCGCGTTSTPGALSPADAVTTSGSNLRSDISPAYAWLQAPRRGGRRRPGRQDVLDLIDRPDRRGGPSGS